MLPYIPGQELLQPKSSLAPFPQQDRVDDYYIDDSDGSIHEKINGVWITRQNNIVINRFSTPKLNDTFIEGPNPYLMLPLVIIDEIAINREIIVEGTLEEKQEQLFAYDQISPTWLTSVYLHTFENCTALTGVKLFVFASWKGIPISKYASKFTSRELISYIRLYKIINETNNKKDLDKVIHKYSNTIIREVARNFGVPSKYIKFIKIENLKKIICCDDLSRVSYEGLDSIVDRYDKLKNHKYKDLFATLYNVERHNSWSKVISENYHPLEEYILLLDEKPIEFFINTFGIYVPLRYANTQFEYIKRNLCKYKNLFNRDHIKFLSVEEIGELEPRKIKEYLSHLKDTEIIHLLGFYVNYSSRRELIRNSVSVFITNKFFFPTVRLSTRCINQETTMLNSITDSNVFMIGYGSPYKYHMYELDELIITFGRDENTSLYSYRKPNDINDVFSNSDIDILVKLLDCFDVTEEITTLKDRIMVVRKENKNRLDYDSFHMVKFKKLSNTNREKIRVILYNIFYSGMFMRKWKGEGHPYPIKEVDTHVPGYNPEKNVLACLHILNGLIEELDREGSEFYKSLMWCEYKLDGTVSRSGNKFNKYLLEVNKGRECIRMASTKLIGTAYHYLTLLYNENIPNFDNKEVDKIQ